MTKEQFIALGFTEEQATKAAAASAEELKTFIPKARFDEVTEAKKKADKDIADRDAQLETLKKTAGTTEEQLAQIAKLQAENKEAAEKHAAELKELALTNAIKSALTGKVHDEALAAGLVDKTKLVIDGDKVVGLDEQLKGLKESKAFLFKPEGNPNNPNPNPVPPGFVVGGSGNPNPPPVTNTLKDAISAHFTK